MKHRKGINLGREAISYIGPLDVSANPTFGDLPDWYAIGGHCPKCEREAWVVRWDVTRARGNQTQIGPLKTKLRCLGCGNREGNTWIYGQLPR